MQRDHAFDLLINSVNVNKYVDADQFDGFTERAEGENIFDVRADSISIVMDKSYLDDNFLPLNEFYRIRFRRYKTISPPDHYSDTARGAVELYYYGSKVFTGTLEDIFYNQKDESLEIEIYSTAMVHNDFPIESLVSAEGKESLTTIVRKMMSWYVNNSGGIADLGITAFKIKDTPIDNTEDFPFYRSVDIDEVHSHTYLNGEEKHNWPGIPYNPSYQSIVLYSVAHKWGYPNQCYVIWARYSGSAMRLYAYRLNEGGPDYSEIVAEADGRELYVLGLDLVNGSGTVVGTEYIDNQELEDSGIIEFIFRSYLGIGYGEERKWYSYVFVEIREDLYYFRFVYNSIIHFLKVEVVQSDLFNYNFKNATFGQILQQLCMVKNAVVHVSPSNTIVFQSRDGEVGLTRKHPEGLTSRVVKYESDYEPPEHFVFLEETKQALIEYYNDYLNGTFIRYNSVFTPDQFDKSEYPLCLKRLFTDNNREHLGIIRAVHYGEDFIEVESEKKVA